MNEQTKPASTPEEDITETTAAGEIELKEEDLNRISGGLKIKLQSQK